MKKIYSGIMILTVLFLLGGCHGDKESGKGPASCEAALRETSVHMAETYRDIYFEAAETDRLHTPEVRKAILQCLGEAGYTAVDRNNQWNMVNPEAAERFCTLAEDGGNAGVTILSILDNGGFIRYDLQTSGGKMDVVRSSLYWENGEPEVQYNKAYTVRSWKYTQKGYFFFEEYYPGGYGEPSGQVALRIKPLDEKCREFNRKYCLSPGYGMNNLFLCDWNESDFGALNFYDIYENFYALKYGVSVTDKYSVDGTVYELLPEAFEPVLQTHLRVETEKIRQRTDWNEASGTYTYRPRGLREYESAPDIPWPEVVEYKENGDGTLQLTVDAIWQEKRLDKAFTHEVTVRPRSGGGFEYVSNRVLSRAEGVDFSWYEKPGSKAVPESKSEVENNGGKRNPEDEAMEAAGGCKDIYEKLAWVEDVVNPQLDLLSETDRAAIVERLGELGKTAVSDGVNMVHYEAVEDFYKTFTDGGASRVTIFNVQNGGSLAVMTFICDSGQAELCYVSVGWEKGGVPFIEGAGENPVQELKLTEKGYLIYAYKNRIAHSHLREYLRVKPLSPECRELTRKCISGLNYRSYKMLMTDWTEENVMEILTPEMFEDIYYVHTGEHLSLKNWDIPADVYEAVFTAAFPVTEEQLRQMENYDPVSHTYRYAHRRKKPLAPFGEVVDYTENGDGTRTLYVDCVWPDYNTDCAFQNQIVVEANDDGTFRYLSNTIESRDMDWTTIE